MKMSMMSSSSSSSPQPPSFSPSPVSPSPEMNHVNITGDCYTQWQVYKGQTFNETRCQSRQVNETQLGTPAILFSIAMLATFVLPIIFCIIHRKYYSDTPYMDRGRVIHPNDANGASGGSTGTGGDATNNQAAAAAAAAEQASIVRNKVVNSIFKGHTVIQSDLQQMYDPEANTTRMDDGTILDDNDDADHNDNLMKQEDSLLSDTSDHHHHHTSNNNNNNNNNFVIKDTTCSICIDPYRVGDVVSSTSTCRHTFHRDCILGWSHIKSECPVCRQQMWNAETYNQLEQKVLMQLLVEEPKSVTFSSC